MRPVPSCSVAKLALPITRFSIMRPATTAAALGDGVDHEIHAKVLVNRLRLAGERLRRGRRLERRPPALEHELELRLGNELLFDPLAHRVLDAVIVGDA